MKTVVIPVVVCALGTVKTWMVEKSAEAPGIGDPVQKSNQINSSNRRLVSADIQEGSLNFQLSLVIVIFKMFMFQTIKAVEITNQNP